MALFLTMSPRQLLIVLATALAIVLAGTAAAVKFATDYLLYENATAAARDWAHVLAATLPDLEQIAQGELPSSASMSFFEWTQRTGQLFRYEIYNLQGFAQLAVQDAVMPIDVAERKREAVAVAETGQPWVDLEEAEGGDDAGGAEGFPEYYSEAFVPVLVDGRPVAIVGAYIDQTEQRARFEETFLVAAGSLCLLSGLAFGIPAIAWYRRTREKQQADRRITYLAHHDGLTGLINRARLMERLTAAMAGVTAGGGPLALLFVDLDYFKDVNDTFGHDSGDFVLKTVAERLRAATRAEDDVARLGGDEFVVLLNPVAGREQVAEFARRMAAAVAKPMSFNHQEIVATLSVGVAVAPDDGASVERLLKSADLALYKSKADGRNCVRLFTPEMDAELMSRLALERMLRRALKDGGLELHFQPEYEIDGRRLIGFEALVRLRADDGTLLPPGAFLPLAEELRLIDGVGAWVLGEACRAAATWPEQLSVAVNVAPSQFANGSVGAAVAAALAASGLAPERLELEITEAHLLGDGLTAMSELRALKAMGVAVVMGHFGTGPSSLSYLWRFPFDKIKIDRSFMKGFEGAGRDAETVVRTIVALGRALHMGVTVEGVETAGQMAFLEGVEADRAQGFYFSQPVPVADVAALIQADVDGTGGRRFAG